MYPVELICNHLESAMFTSKLHFNIYDIWAILSFSTKNWTNLQIVFLLGQIETPTTDSCANYSLFKLNTRLQFVLYQYLYILVY